MSWALGSPSMKVFCWLLRRPKWNLYCGGDDEVGGTYILIMLMSCLCSRTAIDCNSSVLSCGSSASVLAVVCVKGMSVLISVMRPPPPAPPPLSFRSVV